MFCQNCGVQLSDNAKFCHKCGAKVAHAVASSQASAIPAVSEKVGDVHTSSEPESSTLKSAPTEKMCKNEQSFKNYIDSHIRTTTDFQSAEELLNSHISLWKAWATPAIPSILIGIFAFFQLCDNPSFSTAPLIGLVFMAFGLALFPFAILSCVVYFIVWRKRNQYTTKFSGKFEGDFDVDELICFLDKELQYLSPYFHKWGFLQQSGYSVRSVLETSLETTLSKGMEEVRLCTEFGKKTNLMTVLCLRPDILDKESGKKEYFVDAKQKISFGFPQYSTYICVYKTAPIMQAAMEYYLTARQNGGKILTEDTDATIINNDTLQPQNVSAVSQQPQFAAQTIPEKATNKKKSKKSPLILGGLALVIVAFGIFIAMNWNGEMDYVASVKSHEPFTVGQNLPYTCGEVFDKYIIDSQWEVREFNDEVYVDISGQAKGTESTNLIVTIQIVQDQDDSELTHITPKSVSINGVKSTTTDEAVEFLYAMFWMYDEGYDEISELFSDLANPSTEQSNLESIGSNELLYEGIPLYQFIGQSKENVITALGVPLNDEWNMLDYNDIRFYYDGETDKIQYIDVSASVCQINGTTLNKNSYELISMFGEPIYDDWTESDYQRNFIQSNWFISFSFETDSMDEIAEWIFLAQDNY